jgi:methyl-accepting chemotaxis protein
MQLPRQATPVGRLKATQLRFYALTAVNLTIQAAAIVVIALGMLSVSAGDATQGASHLRTLFLIASVAALLFGIGIAIWSQVEVKRRLGKLSEVARGISEGRLDPDVRFDVHEYDNGGRVGLAVARLMLELQLVAAHAERVAAGDLAETLEPRSEHDDLRRAVAGMTAGLREMVGEVSAAADRVASVSARVAAEAAESSRSVEGIARAVGDVSAGAERQVQSVAAVRVLAGEIAAATHASAEIAREAAGEAGRARELARDGAAASGAATAAMDAVRGAAEDVTRTIRSLGERSARIGAMVDAIGRIAEQTNMLALNAAIEAARAGDQGRGFAVVAGEVRDLAEESRRAARSISALVAEIRGETDRAVAVVEEGAARTGDGVATVEAARASFAAIGEAVEATSARVGDIAVAVAQIAGGSARMTEDMSGVATVAEQSSATGQQVAASTEQTSASTQQIAAGADELAGSARELRDLAARFRLR